MSRKYCNNRYCNRRNCRPNPANAVLLVIVCMILGEFVEKLLVMVAIAALIVFLFFVVKPKFTKRYRDKNEREELIQMENIENEEKEMKESRKGKTTEPGYVNANNQKNHGRKEKSDNHYNQWFYEMECLECGHRYNANGSDIWLRKCPKCQGGRP